MTSARSRLYKPALLVAMISLLALSGWQQRRLNRDRVRAQKLHFRPWP